MIFKSSTDLALDVRSGEHSTLWLKQKKKNTSDCSGKQKRWRLRDRAGRREQQDGGTAVRRKCQQSHRGGTSSSHISIPHSKKKKTTKAGQGRCATNGSKSLIDHPISPPRLPVGPQLDAGIPVCRRRINIGHSVLLPLLLFILKRSMVRLSLIYLFYFQRICIQSVIRV